jgi:hypothetical protein
MLFESGREGSGNGGILGNAGGNVAGGGEWDGIDEGGDIEVMSTEGERGRFAED